MMRVDEPGAIVLRREHRATGVVELIPCALVALACRRCGHLRAPGAVVADEPGGWRCADRAACEAARRAAAGAGAGR